ncbi:hypothetical protein [Lysinibacillus xylanilyticus]|uniref:hypothetical protein n=1 Tax=Lysinibacillus xylanilyticus TaxID=582475 RepID=UPI003D011611
MRKRSANVAAATKCFICAKAKRQRQNVLSARKRSGSDKSAQPERKSTTRFGDEPSLCL